MHDLLRHFADGTQFSVQQHVGQFVERFARGKQVADFLLRVGIMEQGTVRLAFHAFPDFLRRRPQADDERMRPETGQIFGVGRQAAAGGDDGSRPGGKFPDQFLFQFAKRRFAAWPRKFP